MSGGCQIRRHVQGDSCTATDSTLFDYLVSAGKYHGRDIETDRLRCLPINHQLVLGGLLDGKIANLLGAFENFIDESSCTAEHCGIVRSVGHQRTIESHFTAITNQWQPMLQCQPKHLRLFVIDQAILRCCYALQTPLANFRKCFSKIVGCPDLDRLYSNSKGTNCRVAHLDIASSCRIGCIYEQRRLG